MKIEYTEIEDFIPTGKGFGITSYSSDFVKEMDKILKNIDKQIFLKLAFFEKNLVKDKPKDFKKSVAMFIRSRLKHLGLKHKITNYYKDGIVIRLQDK